MSESRRVLKRPGVRQVALLGRRMLRFALLRYARAQPRPEELAAADRRVIIVLTTAWGMGGTIRANLNLAGHLAGRYDVEIVSIMRGRPKPFFGAFPDGVEVVTLEDRRPKVMKGPLPLAQRLLRRVPSVLMHPDDGTYKGWSLWVDLRFVRHLRGRAGRLIGTRPGLNLILADLRLPGFATIGEEQMHFAHHRKGLRQAMVRRYPRLDALTVLTNRDKATYEERVRGPLRVVRIPNTVRPMGAGRADLDAPVVLAAGRLSPQKGFDLLLQAWAQVAERHPGWRLRICGSGPLREPLAALIAELGLEASARLDRPASDLPAEMQRSAVFALSSRFEGLPLILLEAMSKGMAVASFDCPTGPDDLIDDHVNGLLVPREDVAGLAAALDELMSDRELRRRCGAAAVETAREYTMAAVGPEWDALLRSLPPPVAAGGAQAAAVAPASAPAAVR
jgi:glycosyltransferase involved in cell wall biosynthesis